VTYRRNKTIVQDWSVIETISDTPRLYILTDKQCAALLAITEFLHWQRRWNNTPGKEVIDAFASETEFNLMNPVTCEMLHECLQDMFDALANDIIQSLEQGYQTNLTPGQPLPDSEVNRDLADGTNPECDHDTLCGEIIRVVDYLVQLCTDALEIIAAQTNELNLAGVVSQITGIDEISIDAVVNYARLLRDGVALNFSAEVTQAYKDDLRCEIYCRTKHTCHLSVNDVYEVLRRRVNAYFETPGAFFTTLQDLLTYLVEQELDGTIVADAMLFLAAGSAKLGSTFLGDIGTTALETIIRLASDEPNNDCEIECTDCPAPGIPVIVETWPGFNAPSGTDIIESPALTWTIESTENADLSWSITIREDSGAVFELSDFVYPDGVNASVHFYQEPDGTDVIVPVTTGVTTPVIKYGWIWNAAYPAHHVQFTIQTV
jgi:hypothetical protein